MRQTPRIVSHLRPFAVAALVLAFVVALGVGECCAEEKSLEGRWKTVSGKANGKPAPQIGYFTTGTVWKLKKDGTATVSGCDDITKYSYDPQDNEFVLYHKFFGKERKLFAGIVKWEMDNIRVTYPYLGSKQEILLSPADPLKLRAKVVSVTLDKKVKTVVVKESPTYQIPKGADKVVEDTVKVSHSVTMLEGWKEEGEIKTKISAGWLELGAGIKSGIEKSTSKTYTVETERKRSVTLKGDSPPAKLKVVWVEYYRTGRAKVIVDGKEVEVPFEFKEDWDL